LRDLLAPDPEGDVETPVTAASFGAVCAFAIVCLAFHAFSAQGWVPLLDSANLALHEAGHPLTGIFSSRLAVYGGTLFQLAFPVAVAVHFHRRGHEAGAAAGAVWLGENLLNVARYMAEFSKPRYGVDVLKVESPVNMKFVAGTRAFGGTAAYSRAEALAHFREAASAATKPFIYLSAGVSDEVFRETLELAIEAGTAFSGVLCGRATWQDGVAAFADQGYNVLEAWLAGRGAQNIEALNQVLAKGATPWWSIYGGQDNIEVI